MATLVVPGVGVETRFDILPTLPAVSGVVGIAGIVDRPPPQGRLVGVTKAPEVAAVLGPGTAGPRLRSSMPWATGLPRLSSRLYSEVSDQDSPSRTSGEPSPRTGHPCSTTEESGHGA
jgi:hypothetical protein